jgi:hypothetical protein
LKSKSKISVNAKSQLSEQIDDYVLSLHNISDNSKEHYSALLKVFVNYLVKRGVCLECSPSEIFHQTIFLPLILIVVNRIIPEISSMVPPTAAQIPN